MKQNDQILISALKNGDISAFDKIFHLYHKRIFSFCKNHFHSHHDAEEVVQDVFLKLWQKKHCIDTDQNFDAYLYTIAKNTIYDSLKKLIKNKFEAEYESKNSYGINDIERTLFYNDLEKVYSETLNQLPKRRREIFHLSRNEGLSNKEISERLDISIKTVENQITMAIDHFKKALPSKIIYMLAIMAFF